MFQLGKFRAAIAAITFLLACSAFMQTTPTGVPIKAADSNAIAAPKTAEKALPAASTTTSATTVGNEPKPNTKIARQGDTSWILTSAALVIFMVFPGISLFYGGLVRRKNIISIYAQCVVIAVAAILSWVLISYSLAFSPTGGAYIGDLSRAGLTGITLDSMFPGGEALEWPMVVFHLSFAIITAALVIGSFAERVRPGGVLLFDLLWPALVYAPIARWVWHADGWLAKMGHMD